MYKRFLKFVIFIIGAGLIHLVADHYLNDPIHYNIATVFFYALWATIVSINLDIYFAVRETRMKHKENNNGRNNYITNRNNPNRLCRLAAKQESTGIKHS